MGFDMVEKRTRSVTLRMAPTEFDMLQELAESDGVYQSDVVRQLVRKAHAERFGERPKRRRK